MNPAPNIMLRAIVIHNDRDQIPDLNVLSTIAKQQAEKMLGHKNFKLCSDAVFYLKDRKAYVVLLEVQRPPKPTQTFEGRMTRLLENSPVS
jgi:uncharacterized protein YigE (DUF2233 family)